MSELAKYMKEAQDMQPDKFAFSIIEGICKESQRYAGEDGDVAHEIMLRIGAMLTTFIETAQKTCKTENTYELEGILGAFRFRYCDTPRGDFN